jgi:hemoglobin/transferrin/lactoferrin receptor protein
MKNIAICILLILSIIRPGFSQVLTIVDKEDLKPVSDVAILNRSNTKFIYSGESGKADITEFSDEEVICFQHFTYERICLTPQEIKNSNYEIKLARKIFMINEFVISANRWEQSKDEVPNKITTVLKPFIELLNPQTTADLIAISDEVFVQKSQLGGGSPMIRGFATNRVLIVVDGVRMNNAIYREGNIQNVISLDPSAIESGEIIFGPGAVVYGSDAIGGVMDFHTKKALFSTGDKPYFKGDAMVRYSSADREKTGHLDFNAGTKKFAFLTSISWSDFDDLKMGSHKHPEYLRNEYVKRIRSQDLIFINPDPEVQIGSGYRQLNTMNKLRLKLSPSVDFVLASHYSHLSDVPRYDRLIQYKSDNQLRYGDWYYGPQVWLMNTLQVTIHRENILFDELRALAGQQSYAESRHDRSFGKATINEQTEKVLILSLNLDFDKSINDGKELIYYGFEFNYNDIRSTAQTRDIITGGVLPAGSRYPNGDNKYNSISVYAGYKNNLTDRLTLNTGLRYNHVGLHSNIADNSFYGFPFTEINISNGAVTGEAGTVFRINEKLRLSLNVSTGFRAPNLDDAGKVFDSAPGVVVVPNPDLRPEYAYSIDLGLAKHFGEIIRTEVSAFYTWLDNSMVRHDFIFNGEDSIVFQGVLSKVEAITNAGTARVYGLHFNVQVNLIDNLKITSALNITEGYEKGGIPLRHSAPLFGSAHLIYEIQKFKADLYANYNGAKKFEKMAPTELEKPYLYAADENGNPWSPGWFTLNFKLLYEILDRIELTAGVENILDLRYRPYSSGIAAPGRNFVTSLRVKF